MKQLLALCLAVFCWASFAQQQPTGTLTSPNLVYSTVNPYPGTTSPGTWSGFTVTTSTGGGTSGGSTPGYNTTTGAFMFGYTQSTIAYNYALSTALKNSGMSWLGYNYAWEYYNQDYSKGTLTANVTFNSTTGTVLHNKSWTLGPTTEGWTAMSGTETFTNPLAVANINSFDLKFSGKDDRFWAGYYGPMVRNPSVSVLYTFDSCSTNPLSSPNCPGYATAYHDQQCLANPLYASDCPGYAAAYQTQQCAANPLYAVTCPGYQTAYFNQQCTANPLYATTCSGYSEAYKTQQCNLNGLYDRTCPNYAEAYAKANTTTTTNTTTVSSTTTTTSTTETASNPATVAISDPVVKSAVTTSDTTSAVSPTSMTSTVSVINPPKTAEVDSAVKTVSVDVPLTQTQQQERQQDQKKTDGAVANVERRAGGNSANAKAAATAQAKELAKKAVEAPTMEAQAATQGLVVGLMGYVPGFSAYQNAIVPDVLGAQVARQYHKPTVDNRSAQRQLSGSNEYRWKEMVDSQYRGN